MDDHTNITAPPRMRRKDGTPLHFKDCKKEVFFWFSTYETEDGSYSVRLLDEANIVTTLFTGVIAFGLVTYIFVSDRWFFGLAHILILAALWGGLAWVVVSETYALWKHPKTDTETPPENVARRE